MAYTATQLFNMGKDGVDADLINEWEKHWYMRGALVRGWAFAVKIQSKPPSVFQNYKDNGYASYKDWIYG